MESVFSHTSFRSYLRAVFEMRKLRVTGYAYRQFAIDLGFPTPSHLQLILSGRRTVQLNQIHRIARALGFSHAEHEFFEALVHENQSEYEEDKVHYRQKLKELKAALGAAGDSLEIAEDVSFLALPRVPLVLVALHGESRSLDEAELLARISSKLKRPTEELAEALAVALSNPALSKEESTYQLDFSVLMFRRQGLAARLNRKNFHRMQLELARDTLEKHHGEKHVKFLSHTFTLNEADFDVLYELLKDIPTMLTRRADLSAPTSLGQLNIQFFVLTGISSSPGVSPPRPHPDE